VSVLLEAEEWGEDVPLDLVWAAIEKAVGSRERLRAAVARVQETAPPADADPRGVWRAGIVDRYAAVRGLVKLLCQVIEFGATTDARPVLTAMQNLPALLEARPSKRVPTGWLDARRADVDLVPPGWWRQLVFPPDRPEGTVDRNAYVFCVLEAFHTRLKRRDIFALVSDRWSDPRARLLTGPAWETAKGPALGALQLPEDPQELLAGHAAVLDAAWRATAATLSDTAPAGDTTTDGRVSVDATGAWRGPASPPGPTCGSSPNRARRRAGASPRASTITPLLNGAPLGLRSIRKKHPHTRRSAHTDRSRSISGPSRSHNIRPAVRVQAVEAVFGKDDEVERRHGGFGAAHHAAIFSAVAWRSPGWVMVGTWNCTSPSTSAPGDGLSPPRPVMTYVPQQSSSLSAPSGEGGRYAGRTEADERQEAPGGHSPTGRGVPQARQHARLLGRR